jgi:aldehyde:ferredoxin oxidoreductase
VVRRERSGKDGGQAVSVEAGSGYTGLYLDIDLSSGTVREFDVPDEWYRDLVGGKGIGSRILLEHTATGVDPLSPENLLIINTGPFTGSGSPCSSRFNVSTKSPLTLGVASSSCGGSFGHHLKRAGVDGLVIKGRAKHPVRLHISGGSATISDASDIWGLDTEETQERLGGGACAVIGPAGENLVRFAAIMSGERAAGRCGVGAVMGSKNLKGITAEGNIRFDPSDPERFKSLVKGLSRMLRDHPITGRDGALPRLGTGMLLSMTNATNTLPTRNFSRGSFDGADRVNGEAMAQTILEGNSGCLSCPIRCARVVRHDGGLAKGPEYETMALFGPNLEVDDLDAIVGWNRTCDLMGIDTISAAGTIGFAMELSENGMIETGLRFGSAENVTSTLEDIATRRGIGGELAEGTWRLALKYGGEDYAIHCRGQELAAYEPRGAIGHGLGYALSNRGACHINGGGLVYLEALTSLTINPLSDRSKPELAALAQCFSDAWATLGLCMFPLFGLLPAGDSAISPHGRSAALMSRLILASGPAIRLLLRRPRLLNSVPVPFSVFPYLELLDALTGFGIRMGDLLEVGMRVNNNERLFNVREGRGGSADALPGRLTRTSQTDGHGTKIPLDRMLSRAYRVRGWDDDGTPTDRTLDRLGIPIRLEVPFH